MTSSPTKHRRTALDAMLTLTFLGFAATSFLFDRAAGLDWVGPDTADPFGRALYWYGVKYDPLVAANPLVLRLMSAISAFIFGPFYLVLARGLWRGSASIRTPAIVYGWVMLYSMVIHIVYELWGELPPPNLAVFAGVYAPYVVAPALLLWRLRRPDAMT